ncbi:reverse transcriptase domain-containing protein [Tanacetum coccineum]
MVESRRSRDMSKYCYSHEEHGHETNQCRELRHQIKEVVKSGKLAHLVKGIKKGNTKASKTPTRGSHVSKRKSVEELVNGMGEITFLQFQAPTIPPILSLRVDSKIPLVGFSGEHSWPLGEVPLEITVGERGNPFNTEHKLNEYKHIEPIKHKKRGLAPERNEAACKEVDELTKAGILREVKYQTWVANPVMVEKSDGGFRLKCYWDAYKGYHQIQMSEGDEDKIAFFTGKGVFYYRKMPFGLKNVGATYQRLVDKSASEEDMLIDIQETFDRLRSINMKLNLKKCSFGVEKGSLLGHLITKQGIKAKPLKVKAITNLKPPRTLKEVQSLNGKLAALSRFLSKGADKSLSVLQGVELNYPELEKLILALVHAARRLRRYFQAYPIRVWTDKPIKQILARPKKSRQIAKWAIELGEHDIEFKGHGASSSDGSGVSLMLVSPEGKEYTYALRFEFETTNNEAIYEELLAGLRIVANMKIKDLSIFVDSQLVANQVKGLFEA